MTTDLMPAPAVTNLPVPVTAAPPRSDTSQRVAIVGAGFAILTVASAIAGRPWVMWVNAGLTVLALIGLGVALTSTNSRGRR